MKVFLRFGRPHTLFATSLQVMTMFILAAPSLAAAFGQLDALFWTWLACLSANLYVVGLNQITDVAIDRVNKPELPLAAGDYTLRQAWGIVWLAGLVALLVGWWQGVPLLLTLALVMWVGTVYSLRPYRLKQRPFWAALSIALARGVVANLGVYWQFRTVFGLEMVMGTAVLLTLLFFFGFGLLIALYKDIPDWAGDQRYAVRTFTVRWGQQRVFALGRWLFTALYLIPIIWGLSHWPDPAGIAFSLAQGGVLAAFWLLSRQVKPEQPASMMRFYLFLWGLFYLEYLFLSFGGIMVLLRA
jgi:homogentisate phytyltransferase/homogentisate geranylgeranyltransferase